VGGEFHLFRDTESAPGRIRTYDLRVGGVLLDTDDGASVSELVQLAGRPAGMWHWRCTGAACTTSVTPVI
jgi:hypothetical protein